MAAVFRLGLAGGGRMGRTHLRALAGSELVEITAIAEPSARSRAELAGAGPELYPGLAEMLAAELDGVLIAAPSAMGGTTIADLGSHLIDLARWMVGEVSEVSAQSQTFIGRRSLPGGGSRAVTVDDASSALLRFASGARGTMEVAPSAVRRPCDFTVEVNGSSGTLMFSYARLNELWYGSAGDDPGRYGMQRIRAEHPSHPYTAGWWPIGQGIGYGASFANQVADLLAGWPDAPWAPGFADGAAVQAVCEAMEVSAAHGRWVALTEITAAGPPA
jgi:predicted dehydrogenase